MRNFSPVHSMLRFKSRDRQTSCVVLTILLLALQCFNFASQNRLQVHDEWRAANLRPAMRDSKPFIFRLQEAKMRYPQWKPV